MRKPNTHCADCEKPLYRRPSELNKWNHSYCKDCSISHSSGKGKIGINNRYVKYIEKWKNGMTDGMRGSYQISLHIKRYLFTKYNNKCGRCGWSEINQFTNKIPLETEHIDGNHKNNKEENLILLCPNCHSLTSTYKGANRGNGRKERKKYA